MKPVILEATATTTPRNNFPLAIRKKLVYIANDSADYAMKVNFDVPIDQTGSFTLKAGEVVSDVEMDCNSISFQGIDGDVAFRLMGV